MDDEDDLDSLGEKLYSLIYPEHPENTEQLTGMLLELPAAVLIQMLQDEAMLTAGVEKARRALQLSQQSSEVTLQDEDGTSQSSDSLGDQLFELVEVYNTGLSHKITGMLLEMPKTSVLHLLSNPKLLEEHVILAMKTLKEKDTLNFLRLLRQNLEEMDVTNTSEADETEKLGEKLFSLVEEMDPLRANDITGMLLEMDSSALQQLLSDHTILEGAVQKAQAVLDAES